MVRLYNKEIIISPLPWSTICLRSLSQKLMLFALTPTYASTGRYTGSMKTGSKGGGPGGLACMLSGVPGMKIGRARQGTRIVLRVGVLIDLVRALLRRLRRALLPQVGHVPPRDPAADRDDAWHEDKGEDAGDEAAVVADVLAEALGRREDDEGVGVEEWLCGYYCGGGGRRAGRR